MELVFLFNTLVQGTTHLKKRYMFTMLNRESLKISTSFNICIWTNNITIIKALIWTNGDAHLLSHLQAPHGSWPLRCWAVVETPLTQPITTRPSPAVAPPRQGAWWEDGWLIAEEMDRIYRPWWMGWWLIICYLTAILMEGNLHWIYGGMCHAANWCRFSAGSVGLWGLKLH